MSENGANKRVAIIGAGPSGLSQLIAFATAERNGAEIPELVCYEKQSDWGGLWNYSWRTGIDENGEPAHGSMYQYLWSNGPKECLEFADYSFDDHFGKPIPSFPPRAVLYDYIIGRAKKNDIRKYIQFNTAVKWVSYDEASSKFMVVSESFNEDGSSTMSFEQFDNVVVSTGHFSTPNVPHFEGVETFPGRVMHAHDFRSADEFAGRDLLIVGGSYSAEDIALQCHKYGAKSVTITYRTAAMEFKWPESMDERPLLTQIDGRTIHFSDGSNKEFDAIILCTGYKHHFPFMEESLRLRTPNILYPEGLYKGVVWNENPAVMYLSMQDQWYTFSHFDLMAWYARDVIMGNHELADKAARTADLAAWRAKEDALEDAYGMIDFQADHLRDLAQMTDYPSFDIDLTAKEFKQWKGHKSRDITTYRNESFASPVTGTMASVHHTEWLEALDDSMETFMAAK